MTNEDIKAMKELMAERKLEGTEYCNLVVGEVEHRSSDAVIQTEYTPYFFRSIYLQRRTERNVSWIVSASGHTLEQLEGNLHKRLAQINENMMEYWGIVILHGDSFFRFIGRKEFFGSNFKEAKLQYMELIDGYDFSGNMEEYSESFHYRIYRKDIVDRISERYDMPITDYPTSN